MTGPVPSRVSTTRTSSRATAGEIGRTCTTGLSYAMVHMNTIKNTLKAAVPGIETMPGKGLSLLLRTTCCMLLGLTAPVVHAGSGDNLVEDSSFDQGAGPWTLQGDATIQSEGGNLFLRLDPTPGQAAEASQVITGLSERNRYTVDAIVRGSNNLVPPIVGVRGDVQIEKSHGWIGIDQVGTWVRRRFEFYTNPGVTEIQVYLQAWKTELPGLADFDEIRLVQGRLPMPEPLPGEGPFRTPPPVNVQPTAGESLLKNPSFDEGSIDGWALGINAEVVQVDGGHAMQLTSSEDTSRATQVIGADLAPGGSYLLRAEARTEPDVVATLAYITSDGFVATKSFSSEQWTQVEVPFQVGDAYLSSGKVMLENWKNQPGAAWFRNLQFNANGDEWVPTRSDPPAMTQEILYDDFSSGTLDPDKWLVSTKAWGGDNGGVTSKNVSLVHDIDDGEPIIALRLQANGDLYSGPIEHNGRSTRVGSAIATREYYASGRYEVRAKVAPELGVVTAFWPFHYIDFAPSQEGYWHEPNPRRNTEIDWEFPTDLAGNDEGDKYGIDPTEISFTNARTNSWGGQFGGEGGEHKGRKVLHDGKGNVIDVAADSLDGKYHTYTIEWLSGADAGDEGVNRLPGQVGSVRWYIDDVLIDQLDDVEFGQGNVPYRAARFWIGAWFPAAGYGDEVGWGGSPDFDSTALHVAWIRISPIAQPRDRWETETVPNIEWATPQQYPEPIDDGPSCIADLDDNGIVDGMDLSIILAGWGACSECPADLDGSGTVDGIDIAILLSAWGPC